VTCGTWASRLPPRPPGIEEGLEVRAAFRPHSLHSKQSGQGAVENFALPAKWAFLLEPKKFDLQVNRLLDGPDSN